MKSNNNELSEFINDSKKLLDFTRCAVVATRYKENKFDFRNYSRKVISLEKKMESKDLLDKTLTLAVNKYFNGINASEALNEAAKEIYEETGQDPRELFIQAIKR